MRITLQMIHEQLQLAGGLTGREAAELLKLKQVHINERQFRHYMSGRSTMPEPVFRCLRDFAREHMNEERHARWDAQDEALFSKN